MWRALLYFTFSIFVLSPGLAYAGPCKIKSETTLYLKGDTDAKMLDCVQKLDLSEIDRIELKSIGGSVRHALQIGDLIAPLKAHMHVKDYCNSSCANYFLPVARSVTIEPKAELLLHGSMDPGIARKAGTARVWESVDAQEAYARTHRIHRGWLMYRNDYRNGGGTKLDYFDGQYGWPDDETNIQAFQVEPKLFKSCFPDIPVTFESPTLAEQANNNERTKRKFVEQKIRPTGTFICKGPFDPNWPVVPAEEREISSETE